MSKRNRALGTLLTAAALGGNFDPAAAQTERSGFEWSGTQRVRYETLDPQFREGLSNSDQAIALQTDVSFDWRSETLQIHGEIMDARTLGNDAGSLVNATLTNTLEPVQAYVAWHHAASTVRIGRVTQDWGKRRLVSRNRYRNTISTFTGVDWSWAGDDGRTAHAFYWRPMAILPRDVASLLSNDYELDHATRNASFKGLFYSFPALGNRHRLETYVLDFEFDPPLDAASATDLGSLGARLYRPSRAQEWSYEVEAVVQRGEVGGSIGGVARPDFDHRASFVHLEIGYQFDAPGSPNLMLQYDRATGDEDPADQQIERFNTLFGARRFDFGPTGIYGIAARGNIESPGVRLTMRPAPKWQAMFAYRSLRLETARDAWAGSGWRDPTGAAGRSIGRHLEGSFSWDAIPDRLSIETGFAHLWAGRFVKQTAGAAFRGDPQYFYTAVTTSF